MIVSRALLEKPIFWDNKKISLNENNLQVDKKNTVQINNLDKKLVKIFDTKNTELNYYLNNLESRQLKILYFNLSNFLEQQNYYITRMINNYIPGFIKNYTPNFIKNYFSPVIPLQLLANKIKTILTERENWIPSSPYPKLLPLSFKENISFLSAKIYNTKIVYEKYFNILNTMREDCIVVCHAHTTCIAIYHDIYKELYKLQHPKVDIRDFKVLRDPLQKLNKQRATNEVNTISVDVVTDHIDDAESAYYFFEKNSSNLDTQILFRNIRETLFKNYQLNDEKKKYIKKKLSEIKNLTDLHTANIGTLLAFCIPKEIAFKSDTKPFYLSGPHGIKLDCGDNSMEDVVKIMQKGKEKEAKACGILPSTTNIIQGRLKAKQITPENKIKIFRINAIPKEIKSQYKQIIKKIAEELFNNCKQGQPSF